MNEICEPNIFFVLIYKTHAIDNTYDIRFPMQRHIVQEMPMKRGFVEFFFTRQIIVLCPLVEITWGVFDSENGISLKKQLPRIQFHGKHLLKVFNSYKFQHRKFCIFLSFDV